MMHVFDFLYIFLFVELIVNIGIINETFNYRNDKLYISDIFVSTPSHTILINIKSGIIYNNNKYDWSLENCSETITNNLIRCLDNTNNRIAFKLTNDVHLQVELVMHGMKTYFNLYIENFMNLSRRCSGLLGRLFIIFAQLTRTSKYIAGNPKPTIQ